MVKLTCLKVNITWYLIVAGNWIPVAEFTYWVSLESKKINGFLLTLSKIFNYIWFTGWLIYYDSLLICILMFAFSMEIIKTFFFFEFLPTALDINNLITIYSFILYSLYIYGDNSELITMCFLSSIFREITKKEL